jgi:hypothetical protein
MELRSVLDLGFEVDNVFRGEQVAAPESTPTKLVGGYIVLAQEKERVVRIVVKPASIVAIIIIICIVRGLAHRLTRQALAGSASLMFYQEAVFHEWALLSRTVRTVTSTISVGKIVLYVVPAILAFEGVFELGHWYLAFAGVAFLGGGKLDCHSTHSRPPVIVNPSLSLLQGCHQSIDIRGRDGHVDIDSVRAEVFNDYSGICGDEAYHRGQ